jgi:hypothetical protein
MPRRKPKVPRRTVYPPWLTLHLWAGGRNHFFVTCSCCGRQGGVNKNDRGVIARFVRLHRRCGIDGAAAPARILM